MKLGALRGHGKYFVYLYVPSGQHGVDPEWVPCYTDPWVTQTGSEGWDWADNMLQAKSPQGTGS